MIKISYKYIDIHKYIYIHTYILIIFIFMGSHYLLICWAQYIFCCDPWIPWAPGGHHGHRAWHWVFSRPGGTRKEWSVMRHAARLIKTLGKWQNICQKRTCFCNIGQWFSYLSLFLIMMWSKQNGTVGDTIWSPFHSKNVVPLVPLVSTLDRSMLGCHGGRFIAPWLWTDW